MRCTDPQCVLLTTVSKTRRYCYPCVSADAGPPLQGWPLALHLGPADAQQPHHLSLSPFGRMQHTKGGCKTGGRARHWVHVAELLALVPTAGVAATWQQDKADKPPGKASLAQREVAKLSGATASQTGAMVPALDSRRQ